MTSCFSLISNYTTISNKKYIFNNNNITNISFGLFDNDNSNNNYLIRGVPSNYPLTFFSDINNDVSNIINFEALNIEPIVIYVSRGQDVSFVNGDFFRFYDSSYQLLNINHGYRTIYDSSLTDVRSNFYFMNSRSYTFKTTTDFCNNFPFIIYGNSLTSSYSLDATNSSFTLTIPANADNSSNKLFYRDNDFDISGNLYILRDASDLKYYYGDISFSIKNYSDLSNIRLSLKSYDFSYGTNVSQFGNKEISNNNLFYYSSSCSYIINNNLPNNNEFLNKVSALDISFIDGAYKLSFNKGRHSNYINNNPSTIYDLCFGLGKGSYIIIDISSAFPIRLSKDISNLITIDKTYQPARIEEVIYGNKTYYYGSFKVNVFDDFSNVAIELLNRTSLEEISYNSKFFYTELPHIQGTTYGSIGRSSLKLLNQQSNYYDLSDSLLTFNKYELNLDTNYRELSYSAVDKYGHNLNILDFVTRIPSSDQTINQEISNNIVNGLFEYNILYKVTDYENNTIQNIRTIVVNYGPIIEISSNYLQNNNIYKNDNQYNNILQFQNNTFNSNYNFFDSINVYIYDISRQRINIPFELSISGEYFDATRNKCPFIHDTSYSYTQPRDGLILNTPYLTSLGKNFYAYYRNFVLYRNTDTDIISIRNYIPSSLDFSGNLGSIIRSNNPFGISSNVISIGSSAQPITLSLIDQKFDLSNITLKFSSVYTKPELPVNSRVVPLNFTLKLNNYFFEISFNSPRYSSDNFKVSGLFNPINFFGSSANNLIDVSYVGSYNLKISTKGLSGGDYFYDTFKNSKFFRPTLTNSSRTYTINIRDISSPALTFYDNTNNRPNTSYVLNYPRIRRFNVLQDICFINLKNFNTINDYNTYISNYVSNKPLIQYRDDSIYDFSYSRDISFTLTRFTPFSNISYVASAKELSLNVITIDSSCVINYRANDICNNWSQDISLVLNFINVPYAELSGNAILSLDFSRNISNYIDAGLRIYTINNSLISLPFIPREISGNSIYETSSNVVLNSTTYNISYNSDICLNRVSVNDYSFNYIITINGSNIPLRLSRKVRVVDREPPKFLFQDFSSINYILNDSRLGINMATYDISYTSNGRSIHSNNSSFNIDFSFVVYRSFNDLSKVLYDFDVSDNYQQQANIRKTLTFGNNTTPFTFNDISNYFDNSINRILNKVTRSTGSSSSSSSSSSAPRLRFNYTIDDSYNIYSVTRNVDIIDNNNPSITFSFFNYYANSSNPYNYQYAYFDASFIDFSYVALDYNKRYTTLGEPSFNFIQELSSILFNFDLSDNFDVKTAVNYIITISNNSVKTSITNARELADLSDNIKALFSLKDTSFSLIYDISDNQFNVSKSTRNVRIIDISTNLDISFLNNSSPLTISFGDTNFNILRDVSFTHKRLTTTSISFDISYSFQNSIPNTITSVSGSSSRPFDLSALIYRLGSNVVNYFPSAYSLSFYNRPRTITISNNGPLITFPSAGISHEIYTPLSDASLIFNVTSNSIYDEFFFANYRRDLSYNGTNFKITFDNCLNILEPSAGLYNIYYSSTDLCGITAIRTRILNVADRRPPVITICGDFIYELSNNSYFIPANSYYKEYGGSSYDLGTRTPFDISIISQRIDLNNNNSILTISYERLQNTKLIYNDPSYNYRIIYSATDTYNNSQSISRNIVVTISRKPILYPYIEVGNNNGVIKYPLTSDISINSRLTLINSINNEDLFYDLSLSFKYDTTMENNQNIICEAVAPIIFVKGRTNNYIKFALEAKSYDNLITLASSFVNVEYENIQSLNITKTHKIYFYARDLSQTNIIDQISFLEYNLNFVDTTPPQLILLTNRNFNTISNLDYPLLSVTSVSYLLININSYANFNNLYNNYENYYKKSLSNNNIVLYDPGINIRDIVSGQVNYIDNSFQKINDLSYDFISSNISINYYRIDGSIIDVCNILFDGCANNFIRNYRQNYNVVDEQGNIGESHFRTINIKRFQPFINLNYQKDCCSNNYINYYHKKFEKYLEPKGRVLDYFDGFALNFENVKITNAINENTNGTYTINYDVSNSADISSNTQRKVDVITTLPLLQNYSYDFSNIINFNFPTLTNITNKTNVKYSLYNGTYKFNVPYNLAFNIKTQEFDICNGLYIINDVVSITSDSSYNINANKFYYNNVVLTLSGDFNRLTIELNNNTIYKNLFVYDNKNTYIDLYDVINNNENNVIIDSSYVVDVSNLNNPNSSPLFVFANTNARNLHLSIGNYRFYQYGYKNFHNPIKFSITKDGTHNGGIEYTKNIFKRNLPGVSILSRNSNSSYTQINIDATTPAILYYYCENFPNMGGQIAIKNNIIFSKQTIVLNNYVIDSDRKEEILNSNYLAAHNISDDDVLKNRVLLTQRFNITGGVSDTSYVNITCITQQNIQHNMLYNIPQQPHKLIIRKHTDLLDRPDVSFTVTDYSIMKANSNNYLVENKGQDFNFGNTYINLFKYDFDSSLNVAKRESDPLLNIYDEDIRSIFYNYKNYNFYNVGSHQLLDEITNYSDFFKKNNLLTKTLLEESFKYKISDFFFANSSKVLNLDNNNEYNYNEKLLAPRIKITNITANYITFTVEIYYNNNNNWYLSNDILNTNKEVLFGKYEYIVYSSSFIDISNVINEPVIRDFVTFYNGSLTITSNLIYSYNAESELSNNFYDSSIFNSLGYSNANVNELTNMIFLSIRDTSNNNASLCGLTEQNLYNNVYFDENQTLIFHKFNATTIVNYQVNSPTLTLEDTLSEATNYNKYLINIAENDIYNFYNERPLNFNTLSNLSANEEYNIYIAFTINNELDASNNYLAQFEIEPIYLNNIPIRRIGYIYRQYSNNFLNSYDNSINTINEISYNSFANRLASHSYVIDLNDYFDINIYKNALLASNVYSTDFIDVNKLNYTLLDMCYNIPFNLYDISASQSVVYNVANLNFLLALRNKIIPLYFKLTYMIKVLEVRFPNVIVNNLLNNTNILTIKDDDNINYFINLFTPDPSNLIANFYTNEVSVAMLNRLYQEIFDNIQLLILKFDDVISSYNIRHLYLINISNFLDIVIAFNYINIGYLDNIVTLLESNVENILQNMEILFEENNIKQLLTIYNSTSTISLDNGNILTTSDISYLDYIFQNFYTLNNQLDLMRKEVAVRNYNYVETFESYKNMMASNITNNSQKRYKNLYSINNLDANKLYIDLKYNFNLLNSNFILDYSYVLYNYANVINYFSPFQQLTDDSINYAAYNDASIVNYESLYNNVENLYNIITEVFNVVSTDYEIYNKPTLYVNANYNFFGSRLLINSYYSNSITFKLNIKYNKSLYQSIDLSTIYLDITIPDLTPPTIIFNSTSDICFNENEFNSDASVNALISSKIISDLSYIDLNQSYSITSINSVNTKYYNNINTPSYELRSLINNNYSLLEIDFTDISNENFNDQPFIYKYIKYILLDNANNRNIITRRITLENDNLEPIFFYKGTNDIWRAYRSSSTAPRDTIIFDQDVTQATFTNKLRSVIKIVDPLLHELVPNLFTSKYSELELTNLLTDASLIRIDYIDILQDTTLILRYYIGEPILDFNKLMNFDLLNAGNNIVLEYFSNTQDYEKSGPGSLRIKLEIIPTIVIAETIIDTHCCYPKVEYKPIQDNYKLGSQNTTVMRMAKLIINRHI